MGSDSALSPGRRTPAPRRTRGRTRPGGSRWAWTRTTMGFRRSRLSRRSCGGCASRARSLRPSRSTKALPQAALERAARPIVRRIRTSSRRIGVEMTEYFLFFDDRYLVKVIDHVEAFRFVNGKWHEADGFRARVTGMGGDCD